MINLPEYIKEGLKINSKSKIKYRDVDSLKDIDIKPIIQSINKAYKNPSQKTFMFNLSQMKKYKSKCLDPQSLTNSMNEHVLILNWYNAILIDWIECALVFKDEIIKRGYFSIDELNAYIFTKFTNYCKDKNHINNDYANNMKKYLDEVGIEL